MKALTLMILALLTALPQAKAQSQDQPEPKLQRLEHLESIRFTEDLIIGENTDLHEAKTLEVRVNTIQLKPKGEAHCTLFIYNVPPMTKAVIKKGREFRVESSHDEVWAYLFDSANRKIGDVHCSGWFDDGSGERRADLYMLRSNLERALPITVKEKVIKLHEINYQAPENLSDDSAATAI